MAVSSGTLKVRGSFPVPSASSLSFSPGMGEAPAESRIRRFGVPPS